MTGIANIAGAYMIRPLTTGEDAIVTGNTISSEVSMINYRSGGPALRVMTGIALFRGRNMIRAFARCYDAIVAARTSTNDFIMVDRIIGNG